MQPSIAEIFNQALARHQAGALAEAEVLYRQALSLHADHAGALHGLGLIACEVGQHPAGIELIRKAIAADPSALDYQRHLGQALLETGAAEQAVAVYRQLTEHQPTSAAAWTDLGIALRDARRFKRSLAACRQAIALDPNSAFSHSVMGDILDDTCDLDGAIAAYRRAIDLSPDSAQTYNALANVYFRLGLIDDAIACARQAIAIAQRTLQPAEAAAHRIGLLLMLYYDPRQTAPSILDEHRRWAENFSHLASASHDNDRSPDRPLRIGYVSPDFNGHPVGRFLVPLLEHCDRDRFHVICYSDTSFKDATTVCLRNSAAEWRDINHLSDDRLAAEICSDRVDILVDLALHTKGNRLRVFACKPAPVQITYLGYPGTSGLAAMDWRVTEANLDPPPRQHFGSENPIYLPHVYWCYPVPIDSPSVTDAPCVAGAGVRFGCFNNFCKFSNAALQTWAKILMAVDRSELLLVAECPAQQRRAREVIANAGADPSRVQFLPRQTLKEYLRSHDKIDIALDPFPFNGGMTSCDALWMGVPLVTLRGHLAVGRMGTSLLSSLGLSELIANSAQQYIEIAAQLAADPSRLNDLRLTLRQRMLHSRLCDAASFAKDIESLYRTAWMSWCQSAGQ